MPTAASPLMKIPQPSAERFDYSAFDELNKERFGGALAFTTEPDGEIQILRPADMNDRDREDARVLLEQAFIQGARM